MALLKHNGNIRCTLIVSYGTIEAYKQHLGISKIEYEPLEKY